MATSTRSALAHDTSESAPHRPSKKSSFLSLKREKHQADTLSASPQPDIACVGQSSPGTSNTVLPSPYHASDFEIVDQPIISGPYKLKKQRSSSISKTASKTKGKDRLYHDFAQDRQHESIPWPVMELDDVEVRSRTTSGSSHRPWDFGYPRTLKYPYRDSGSSTLSHFDPLPQTPVDDYSFRGRVFASSDVVAAPVSGVETMDALVDGMNGSSDDDHYSPFNSLSARSHHKNSAHHPLYHPPLPKPPPGVTLGGGLPRKSRKKSESDSEGEKDPSSSPRRRKGQEKHARSSGARTTSTTSRTSSTTPITRNPVFTMPKISMSSSVGSFASKDSPPASLSSSTEENPREPEPPKKSMAPSISEIIRTHAPALEQARTRPLTIYSVSDLKEKAKTQAFAAPPALESTDDLISRSSVDTIAEEVRQTLRLQTKSPVGSREQSRVRNTFSRPQSAGTEYTRSPLSECGAGSSIHSRLEEPDTPPAAPLDLSSLTKAPIDSPSQAIAQYLRSSRLTTVLRLTRGPHASRESPLNVSFSDLGSATGAPLIVFLGLGCVRHIMGLYDEMAELLGIRLITIDRWGLGRTDCPRSKLAKGIPEWASVVEEVLDRLNIDQCSVMAHSAGAPYALAFANRFPERIRGDVCLLAPWVGGADGAGYKWLKYVPNGILKTAQAAEWKVQAWMLGKPPSLAYEGIGFEAQPPPKLSRGIEHIASPTSPRMGSAKSMSSQDTERRSLASSGFSDYDDLRDFDGRFESTVNLNRPAGRQRTISESKPTWHAITKKTSKGILGRFARGGNTQPSSPTNAPLQSGPGRKLKALRSMGSLKGRGNGGSSSLNSKKGAMAPSAWTPIQSPRTSEVGLGLEDVDWDATIKATSPVARAKSVKSLGAESSIDLQIDGSRAAGRRSISFGANMPKSPRSATAPPVPPLPVVPPSPRAETAPTPGISYQAQLGNALIAASHAESQKGTHGDLLQILNHDRQPWGFSYSAYPHSVRVWYGDRDERIAENAVRWMENAMGTDKCQVQVVKGADHALMFKSAVVVEVLEYISECWRPD